MAGGVHISEASVFDAITHNLFDVEANERIMAPMS
jgi:hypothetical protein